MSKLYLIFIIIISILLLSSNIFLLLLHPIHTIYNLILICALIPLVYLYSKNKAKSEKYNYDLENPNALITGENVAGTVYASYPENTPGLGWVL